MTAKPVHVVVPSGIDDRQRPSGGNRYDRRLMRELGALGWRIEEHRVVGAWPRPDAADQAAFATTLAAMPDGATVLVDGLIGSVATAMTAEADRLQLVVLLHMPLAEAALEGAANIEGAVLRSASAVITTSEWARGWVIDHHGVVAEHVRAAVPGVDSAPTALRSASGTHFLCVGPITPAKGYDTLLEALRSVADLEWRSTWVGSLELAPQFAGSLAAAVDRAGLSERITLRGPLAAERLDTLRQTTDLAVSASVRESFGMAVAEALGRGIPAVATAVGGHAEVIADAGILVPAGDAAALATALRRWLTDSGLRERLRRSAVRRQDQLTTWRQTAGVVDEVLRQPVNQLGRRSVLHLGAVETGGGAQ